MLRKGTCDPRGLGPALAGSMDLGVLPLGQLTMRGGHPHLLALRDMQFQGGAGCDPGTVTPSVTW